MKNNTQLREYWEKEYENTKTQFDIEKPDRWVAKLEEEGKIKSNILDAGCGPGRTARYLAKLGYNVIGADISGTAIERAMKKAAEENIKITFLQADMTTFSGYPQYFDTIIDIGCFHSLPKESDQKDYARVLSESCRAGATVYLRAFSARNLQNQNHPPGVPAISENQIRQAFSPENGWQIKSLNEKQIELLVANNQYKKGYCWFAEISK